MKTGLEGKVVVITGANSGIGLACALAFASEGARVVGGDHAVTSLVDIDGIPPVQADLLAPEGPGRLVERAVREFGAVDVIVNNLGGAKHRESFLDASDLARQGTGSTFGVDGGVMHVM